MQAIWMVRSRQIARKLAFWLAVIGYNPRDRSFVHSVYLAYAVVFMCGWSFAMLSLFAGVAADWLKTIDPGTVNLTAAHIGTLGLTVWGLFTLWQVTRRSPFLFSEDDAHRICQTPVPRSGVALAWFLGDWFEPAVPFLAGAVTLGFAQVESRLDHKVSSADIPIYAASGLRSLFVIGLLHFGTMAFLWAVGALRLQRNRSFPWLPRLALFTSLAVGLGLISVLARQGLNGLDSPFWRIFLWPLAYPAQAAFGAAPVISGLMIAFVFAGLGLLALAWTGAGLNLSRAAQETVQKEKIETALRYGQRGLAQDIALRDRLGAEHAPTRLPGVPGIGMMVWKDLLQSVRSFGWHDAWSWLTVGGFSFGVWLAPNAGSLGLLLFILSVLAGQRATSRLQKDLALWSLLRTLPFPSGGLLLAEMAFPMGLMILLGWASLALTGGNLGTMRPALALLLPFLTAALSFAAAYDLLRQARSDMLLSGSAPGISMVGGLLGFVCLAVPAGFLALLIHQGFIGGLAAFAVCLLMVFLFWRLAAKRLRLLDS